MECEPINPGRVEWSGENPSINLKAEENGPFTCLISFFRVVYSPYGRGHAVIVLWDPQADHTLNGIYTDNPTLARWLADNYAAYFSAFKVAPAFRDLRMKAVDSVAAAGDAFTFYAEIASGPGVQMRLTWSQLGEPFMAEMPPSKSSTKEHEMFSVFVPAGAAEVEINGQKAEGRPFPREMAGKASSTAFLAFSETWVRPSAGRRGC